MYVRVLSTQLKPEKVDDAISIWREKVAPELKQAKGFKGAYLAGDRKTGRGVTITLWETEADATAMNATLTQTPGLFDEMFTEPPQPSQYEMFVQL